MRIAFVADDLYPGYGGQAAATEGHIEALLARGHEVRVLAGVEREPSEPPPGVSVARLPVWRPGEKQTHIALPDSRKIRTLLDWAEVVQINTPTPLSLRTLQLARRAGVPAVVGFHTQEESAALHFFLLRPLVQAILRAWYTHLYRRPDLLVAPTPFAAEITRRYTSRPVHVVSNGIRIPETGTSEESEESEEERALALRKRLLRGRSFLFAHVGRLTQEKRPRDLLSVASALARSRRDWRLVVAGDGPLRRRLERRVDELGLSEEVSFLGYVSEGEKSDLLVASDLFFMPSPTELQSIATLEAMARGCAVAAADFETSAVGPLVREAECGVAYRPEQAERASESISGLLDHPVELRRMQNSASNKAREHDFHRSGERLERIYEGLIRNRTNGSTEAEQPLERTKN